MEQISKTHYLLKKRGLLSSDSLSFMMELYLPIIGKDATFLYLFLMNQILLGEVSFLISDLEIRSRLTRQEFLLAKKALESIGLLSTYQKATNPTILLVLSDPETPKNFFNNIVLKGLFVNATSEQEFEKVLNKYALNINLKGYEDISASVTDSFKIEFSMEEINLKNDVQLVGRNKGNFKDNFSTTKFNNYLKKTSQLTINSFSEEELSNIRRISTLYGISEELCGELVLKSIDASKRIGSKLDLMALRNNVQVYVKTFNLDAFKTFKKTEIVNSNSDIAKRINFYENTSPRNFIKSKQNNIELVNSDKKIIDYLAFEMHFTDGMINALLDYVMRIKNGDLNKNYILKIASNLVRGGATDTLSVLEALEGKKDTVITSNTQTQTKKNETSSRIVIDDSVIDSSSIEVDDDEDYDII